MRLVWLPVILPTWWSLVVRSCAEVSSSEDSLSEYHFHGNASYAFSEPRNSTNWTSIAVEVNTKYHAGGGLAAVPWFIPMHLGVAVAGTTCALYLLAAWFGFGTGPPHMLGMPGRSRLRDNLLEDFGDVQGRVYFIDNCRYVLMTLLIARHFLDHGLQPSEVLQWDGFGKCWWMQAIKNYCDSFIMPMFAFCSGLVSKGFLTPLRIKHSILRVFFPMIVINYLLLPVNRLRQDWYGIVGLPSPYVANETTWFLQALLLWRFVVSLLSTLRPGVFLAVAYVISWLSGYWFESTGAHFGAEAAFPLLGFYATGYLLPLQYLSALNRAWVKLLGVLLTATAITAHMGLASNSHFASKAYGGPSDSTSLSQFSTAVAMSSTNASTQSIGELAGNSEYCLFYATWQRAALRSYYFNAGTADMAVYWLAWTQRLATQLLFSWPAGLALLAIVPHGFVFFTDWGTRTIYPLIGQVFSFWAIRTWLASHGVDASYFSTSPVQFMMLVAVGSNLVNIMWAARITSTWVSFLMEPSWLSHAFVPEDELKGNANRVKKRQPFSRYASKLVTSITTPTSWFYAWGNLIGQKLVPRCIIWFVVLIPLVHVFVRIAYLTAVEKADLVFSWMTMLKICILGTLYQMTQLVLAPWPDKDGAFVNDRGYTSRIGCVVACHKSAGEIVISVRSLLRHLRPEHIVIADNGNSADPLDDTEERLKELDPDIVYVWVPVGHKTNALWVGVNRLPGMVDYVMLIDDDTVVPTDMVLDESYFDDPGVSGVSFGISMNQTGIVEKMVDMEFKVMSQQRLFHSYYSTVWFNHGIIGIWRRNVLTETLREHPCLPFGEDQWNGTINLLKNLRMRQELRSYVLTYAPPVLFPVSGGREQGYGAASLWKQRAERWFVNAPRRTLQRIYLLFFYRHPTFLGNLVFRILSIEHILTIYTNLQTPLFLAFVVWSAERSTLMRLAGFILIRTAIHQVEALYLNFVLWRHRPDVQVDLIVCLLWPAYQFLLQCMFYYGHWRCLLYYIPFFPVRMGLYTSGHMTPELLRELHGIDSVPDCCPDESDATDCDLEMTATLLCHERKLDMILPESTRMPLDRDKHDAVASITGDVAPAVCHERTSSRAAMGSFVASNGHDSGNDEHTQPHASWRCTASDDDSPPARGHEARAVLNAHISPRRIR